MTVKKPLDVITFDRLAALVNMSSPDQIEEHIDEQVAGLFDRLLAQEYTEEEAQKIEDRERRDLYMPYYNEVVGDADRLFEAHGLTLIPKLPKGYARKSRKGVSLDQPPSWDFKIVPTKSWNDALSQIRMTMNGMGYFHFNSNKEFLESGPYTAREAVLKHLGTMGDYRKVYGRLA